MVFNLFGGVEKFNVRATDKDSFSALILTVAARAVLVSGPERMLPGGR